MLRGEELEYCTSRGRSILLLVGALLFVLVGVFLIGSGEVVSGVVGWLCVLFFGVLGVPILLWRSLRPTVELKVHRDRGVWLRQGDASWVPWAAIRQIGIVNLQRQDIVVLVVDPMVHARRLAASRGAARSLHRVNAGLIGQDALAVPSPLTIRPPALVQLLGELAERCR